MRSLLEFVSCCGSPRTREEEGEAPTPAGEWAEETRALVGQRATTNIRAISNISVNYCRSDNNNNNDRNSCNNNNDNHLRTRKKRRRRVGNRSDEWKPSLGPISEHHVAVGAEEEAEAKAKAKRVAKRRGGDQSGGSKKSSRDMESIAAFYEESRASSFGGSVMPTFSGYTFLM